MPPPPRIREAAKFHPFPLAAPLWTVLNCSVVWRVAVTWNEKPEKENARKVHFCIYFSNENSRNFFFAGMLPTFCVLAGQVENMAPKYFQLRDSLTGRFTPTGVSPHAAIRDHTPATNAASHQCRCRHPPGWLCCHLSSRAGTFLSLPSHAGITMTGILTRALMGLWISHHLMGMVGTPSSISASRPVPASRFVFV